MALDEHLVELRRQLPLPQRLNELMEAGRWLHPGDDVMLEKVPFIRDPLDFLRSREQMLACGPLMGPTETENAMFSEYRGSVIGSRDLPWIDVEKTLFVICNKWPGDDVGIALDYRTGIDGPRVVGGDWSTGKGCIYCEISPTFDAFADLIGV